MNTAKLLTIPLALSACGPWIDIDTTTTGWGTGPTSDPGSTSSGATTDASATGPDAPSTSSSTSGSTSGDDPASSSGSTDDGWSGTYGGGSSSSSSGGDSSGTTGACWPDLMVDPPTGDQRCVCPEDGAPVDPALCGCGFDLLTGACMCNGAMMPSLRTCAWPCVMADKGCVCGELPVHPSWCD